MSKKIKKNIILGIFTLLGLTFLIALLYTVGKNKNLLGSNYTLKAQFENVQGLRLGDNVRFAGIDVGTVSKLKIINDSVIEISMRIESTLKNVIKKNSIVSIGTDGLVGNKVVYITTSKKKSPYAQEGDLLSSKKPIDTDEMLKTLHKTNNSISIITDSLKSMMVKLNGSSALWNLLSDENIHTKIVASLNNINQVTENLDNITNHIKKGDGPLGTLLYDNNLSNQISQISQNLDSAILSIKFTAENVNHLADNIQKDFENNEGILQKLIKDTLLYNGLKQTIHNAEKGTENFNLNMKALQNNFLFRNYFKKLKNKQQE